MASVLAICLEGFDYKAEVLYRGWGPLAPWAILGHQTSSAGETLTWAMNSTGKLSVLCFPSCIREDVHGITHSTAPDFCRPIISPHKRYNLRNISGMFICAEDACMPQTGGNEVAIWYRMCNHNEQNSMDIFFFLPPLATSGKIFGGFAWTFCSVFY